MKLANQSALDAIAEETGTITNPEDSGIPGKGRRYEAAVARGRFAKKRIGEIKAQIARLERGGDRIRLMSSATLASIRGDLARLEKQRDHLEAVRDRLLTGRSAAILAAAKADPDFVPLQDGLVIRLAAMLQLARSPAVLEQVIGLKAVIMLIEMGGLITKLLLVAPSLYAVRTASEFAADSAEVIARAQARIAENVTAALDAADALDARREQRDRDSGRRRTATMTRNGFGDLFREVMAASRPET